MKSALKAPLVLMGIVALAGCSTISLPTKDLLKAPDFQDDVASMEEGFMSGADIPAAPSAMRSAAQWDQAARELEALGASLDVPVLDEPLSDAEFEQEYRSLQAYAVEYREDDPQ